MKHCGQHSGAGFIESEASLRERCEWILKLNSTRDDSVNLNESDDQIRRYILLA